MGCTMVAIYTLIAPFFCRLCPSNSPTILICNTGIKRVLNSRKAPLLGSNVTFSARTVFKIQVDVTQM